MGHRLGVVRMPIFGDIDGVPVGATFPDRRALLGAGVYRQLQAGIVGSAAEGADSIVVSGGYEDDDDFGTSSSTPARAATTQQPSARSPTSDSPWATRRRLRAAARACRCE
jgi:hypothetical protein